MFSFPFLLLNGETVMTGPGNLPRRPVIES